MHAACRCAFVLVLLATVSVSAQWPSYVPPNTPRLWDGTVNLAAAAPRTPDGKPDLSGVWDSRVPPAGRLGAPMLPSLDGAPVATFVNVGANLKDGLPFTPWAAELRRQRMASNSRDNPDAHCLPLGFMQLHTHSQPRKIVQSATVMVIAYEANAGLRQVFLDGRPVPTGETQLALIPRAIAFGATLAFAAAGALSRTNPKRSDLDARRTRCGRRRQVR